MMRPMLEATKKKAIDSYERINQWFLDRKIGGSAYQEYMENATETKKMNLKKISDLEMMFKKENKNL